MINTSAAIWLFMVGVGASFGPCLVLCPSMVILPYIAGTRRGWREGLKAISIFLFTRLFVYVLWGLLAGLLGGLLARELHQFRYLALLIGGLFISSLGLLIIFGKDPRHHLCQALRRRVVDNSPRIPILLGLTGAILPCLPLLAVISYIALEAQNLWQGAFYGSAFGMGKFITPLIPLGVLASTLPAGLIKNPKVHGFFSRFCGFILFLIGVNLIVFRIWR